MARIRTFVAVEVTPGVQARARQLIDRLRPTTDRVRWVDPGNLHLTLSFLGEVDLNDMPAVCERVSRAVSGLEPFEIEVHGVGAFPDLERPRTLWLGVTQGVEEMVALHDAVQSELAELGFREEQRRYRPHLTLGRLRQGDRSSPELKQAIEQYEDFHAGAMEVDAVVVFSSQLGPGGPLYQAISTAELTE